MTAPYLVLAIVGAVAPDVFFLDFMVHSGRGLVTFVDALFANGASGGFTADLVISSVVFWAFLWGDAGRSGVRYPWIYVLVNLLIGLSCALPLYLYVRSRRAFAMVPGTGVPGTRHRRARHWAGCALTHPEPACTLAFHSRHESERWRGSPRRPSPFASTAKPIPST